MHPYSGGRSTVVRLDARILPGGRQFGSLVRGAPRRQQRRHLGQLQIYRRRPPGRQFPLQFGRWFPIARINIDELEHLLAPFTPGPAGPREPVVSQHVQPKTRPFRHESRRINGQRGPLPITFDDRRSICQRNPSNRRIPEENFALRKAVGRHGQFEPSRTKNRIVSIESHGCPAKDPPFRFYLDFQLQAIVTDRQRGRIEILEPVVIQIIFDLVGPSRGYWFDDQTTRQDLEASSGWWG